MISALSTVSGTDGLRNAEIQRRLRRHTNFDATIVDQTIPGL